MDDLLKWADSLKVKTDDSDDLLGWADSLNVNAPSGDVNSLLNQMRGSVVTQESGGNPKARNARTSATGLFQVMPPNIPVWTKQYVGRPYTQQEFANDPNAQEKVFRGEMGKYLKKAKQKGVDDDTAIRMASAAWYGGESAMGRYDDAKRFRSNEPSFREYTTSILNRIKKGQPTQPPQSSIDADAIMADVANLLGTSDAPPVARDILPTVKPSPTFPGQPIAAPIVADIAPPHARDLLPPVGQPVVPVVPPAVLTSPVPTLSGTETGTVVPAAAPVDPYQQWLATNKFQDDQYSKESFAAEQAAEAQKRQIAYEPQIPAIPTNKESLQVQEKGVSQTDPDKVTSRPEPKDEKVTLQWTRGGDALTNALDQAASEYASRIGVDYALVRDRMRDMQPQLTPEKAEHLRRENKPYSVTLEATTVRELQAEQNARTTRKAKADTDYHERIASIDPNLSAEERELEEMRLRGLADADAGLRSFAEVAETYEDEKKALAEWNKQNPKATSDEIKRQARIASSLGGDRFTSAGERQARQSASEKYLTSQSKTDRESARQKVIAEYGSLANWKKDQDKAKREFENLTKNTSPLFAQIVARGRNVEAFVGGAAKAVPEGVAAVAETVAIAQEAIGKTLGTSDLAATERVAHKFGQDLRALSNEFIKIHKAAKGGLVEQAGNVFGQVVLMVGTGGAASLATGSAKLGALAGTLSAGSLGGAAQYTEATDVMRQNLIDRGMTKEQADAELKKSNWVRLGASGTGFVLSSSDYFLMRGVLGAAKATERIGFLRNFKDTVKNGLISKGIVRSEADKIAMKAADDLASSKLKTGYSYAKAGTFEAVQESVLEAKGNDLYAYMTYDNTPERAAQLLSYTDENKIEGAMGFLGGLFGKKIGSIVQGLQRQSDTDVKQIADALRLVPDVPTEIADVVTKEAKKRNITLKPIGEATKTADSRQQTADSRQLERTFTDKQGNKFELIEEQDGKLKLRNEKGGIVLRNNDRRLTETTNETKTEEVQEPVASVVETALAKDTTVEVSPDEVSVNEDIITPKDVSIKDENINISPERVKTIDINEDVITPKPVKEAKIVAGREVTREEQELTKTKEQRDVARRDSETDPLTGVANRRALDRALPSAEADKNTSVIAFDANSFGLINKKLGEAEGDKVLKEMVTALDTATKENGGRIFRKGGDEFTVLAPKAKAEAIRDRAEKLFGEKDYKDFKVSVSGVVGNAFVEADAELQKRKAERKALQNVATEPTSGNTPQNRPFAIAVKSDKNQDAFNQSPDFYQAQGADGIAKRHGLRPVRVYDWANRHDIDLAKDGDILSDPKFRKEVVGAVVKDTGISPESLRSDTRERQANNWLDTAKTQSVTDIGQLSKDDIRSLNQAVKRGELVRGKGGRFPAVKTVYAPVGFDFAADREAGLKEFRNAKTKDGRILSGESKIVRLDDEAERGRVLGGRRNVESSLVLAGIEGAGQETATADGSGLGSFLRHATSPEAKSKIADLRNITSDKLLPQVEGGKFVGDNLELNEADQELLRRLLGTEQKARTGNAGQQTSFYGILLDAPLLRRLAALGRVKQIPTYKKAGYNDADLNGYTALLKNLGELAKSAKDFGITYVFDEALPEELVHQEDMRAGRTDADATKLLKQSPFFTDTGTIFNREYPGISEQNKLSEIAAKLITGQASKYGWNKLPNFGNLRIQFLNTWADGIVRNNKEFIESNGIEAFKERFARIYENTTPDTTGQADTQRSDSTDQTDRPTGETVDKESLIPEPDQRGRDNAEKKNRQFARSLTKHLMDIADVPYDPQSFEKWTDHGEGVIAEKGIDGAMNEWRKMSGKDNEGRRTALGVIIAKELRDAGRDGDYRIFGEELTNAVSNVAQELAAAKMLSRLNPDFAPIHGDKITRKAHNRPQTPEEFEKTQRLAEELKDAGDREILAKESIVQVEERIENLEEQNAELEKLLEGEKGRDRNTLEKALKAAKASAAYYKALVEEKRSNAPNATRTPAQIKKFKEKIDANRSDYMKRISDAFQGGILTQAAISDVLKQAAPVEIKPELLEALTDLSAETILNGLESGLTPEQFNKWLDKLTNESLTEYEKAYVHAMAFDQIRSHKSLTPEAKAKLKTRYMHARVANQILQAEEREARAAANKAIKDADAFKYDKFARLMVDTAEKIDASDEAVFIASLIRNYRDMARVKNAYAEAFDPKTFNKHFIEARELIDLTKSELEKARIEGKEGIKNITVNELNRFKGQEKIARKEKFIKLKEIDNHYKELSRSTTRKTVFKILDAWNLIRAVQFSMDAGFALAQGGPTLFTSPTAWYRAMKRGIPASAETPALNRWLQKQELVGQDQGFGDLLRKIPKVDRIFNRAGFTGDKFMDAVVAESSSPFRARSEAQGVKYETIGATQDWNESIMSKLSEKIPLVRQTNFAHSLVGDLFRLNQSERYLKWLDDMESRGKIDAFQRNRAEEFMMKKWVNVMTGKGYLGPLENVAWAAAQVMSAPRYTASAFQALYYANPARIPFVPKGARLMVAQDAAKLYGAGAGLILLLGALGWMNLDPEDKDFLVLDANKIPGLKNVAPDMKITLVRWLKESFRLTIGLGLKYAIYQGLGKDDAAKRIEKQWFNEFVASDFGGIGNYWRGRQHPAISLIRTNVTGKNFVGDPVGWEDVEEWLPLPLTIKETIGSLKYDRRESILKSGKAGDPADNVVRMLLSVVGNGIGLGIGNYPSADTTVAQKQARAMMGSGADQRSDEEKESSRIANQLERAIREGYDVTEELKSALTKGQINDKQAKSLQKIFLNEVGDFQQRFGVKLTEEQKQIVMSHRRAFKIIDYLWGKGFQLDRDKIERTLEFATKEENTLNDRAAQAEAETILLRSLLRSKKTSKPDPVKQKEKIEQMAGPETQFWDTGQWVAYYNNSDLDESEKELALKKIKRSAVIANLKGKLQPEMLERIQEIDPGFKLKLKK